MITPTKTILSATLVSAIAVLSGCSADMGGAGRDAATQRIDSIQARVDAEGSRLAHLQDTGRPSNMSVRDGVYLGRDGFRTGHGDPLPRRLEKADAITLKMGDEISLGDLVPILQRATGLRIDIRDLDTIAGASGQRDGGNGGSGADSAGAENDPAEGGSSIGTGAQHPASKLFRVNYEGSLSNFLDYVAAQVGADWEYTGGRVKFLGPQTTSYTIWALPGELTASGSVGGGGSDAFGSGTPPTTSYQMSYDYWQDIEAGLTAIVPEVGAKFSINRASGTVTLTGFRNVHERVQTFISEENARLSRQVAVKIDVLAFQHKDSDRRGTNINAVLEQVSAGLQFDIVNTDRTIPNAGQFGMTILDKDDGPLKNLTGSSAIISALAEKGRVAQLESTSVIASNNKPTPVSITNERGYIAGIITSQEEDGSTSTELQTGVINDGLNLTFTPRVMSDGNVMMTYHMALTELINLESFSAGETMVQLPEVENRTFMQTVSIGSGDAMVVAAHDSNKTGRDAFGPFSPSFWGLGGQDGYSVENTKIVILMTPTVIEAANAPRRR